MTQNGDENAKFLLWEIFYGHIRFQHYHIYQKPRERKRSMEPVDILGGQFTDLFSSFTDFWTEQYNSDSRIL